MSKPTSHHALNSSKLLQTPAFSIFPRWVLSFKVGSEWVSHVRLCLELLHSYTGGEGTRRTEARWCGMLWVPTAHGDSLEEGACTGASLAPFSDPLLSLLYHSLEPKGKQNTFPPDKLLKKGRRVCKSHFQPKRKLLDAKEREKGDFIGILHPSMIGDHSLSASCRPATPAFFMNWNSLVVPRQGIFFKSPSPYLR